ncbi:MAG: tetratricopeptide repeat protein [Methanothrix sp.]
MTGVTWLHLSDWHQDETKFKFNRKVVCDALIKDIKAREKIDPRLKDIDFIVFSGDAAKAGLPEEYKKAAEDLFRPLLDACKLGPDRLFIIPGNHDLDRDRIPVSLSKLFTSNEQVESCWKDKRSTELLLQPFQDFHRFLADLTGEEIREHCDFGPIDIDGKKVSLLGINSAWTCARHKDEKGEVSDQGYLCIGEPQIYESLEKISGSNVRIALLHHPLDWLAPFDLRLIEVHLKRKCNFILHGHAHKPGASAVRDNFGYYITIPAGACYDRSMSSNSDYTYSYNYVHLDLDSDRGVVFLRKWSELNRNWRKDDETSPPNGEFDFSISGSDKPQIPHQIPDPPGDFKGRKNEIRDILSKFEKGATITGLQGKGGVGKTALALVLAQRVKNRFPDGQIFIDMRGTSTKPDLPPLKPEEAMAHVIRAFRPAEKLPADSNELQGLYKTILSDKHVLLLLDNASNGQQVEPLLPPAGCSVIITSRLKFTLPCLAETDLEILPPKDARDLLLAIAPRIGDGADELANLCGYLPIALRHAASSLAEKKDLKVSEYEKRLKDKVARLELENGSFSLSYELLTPLRKKNWRRLSVFPEDFDRDAATAVLTMNPEASAEALSDLVRWSLVDFYPGSDSEEGRYKLHDLARVFAESCLEQGELANIQQIHANHYSKVLSEANDLYLKGGTDLLEGLKLFDLEWANIKAGQAWARSSIQSKIISKKDLQLAANLAWSYANTGVYVLDLRLHPRDEISWLETGLDAAKKMKDLRAEEAALSNLGFAYHYLGESRKAIEFCVQAIEISREIGDRNSEGIALGNLGNAYSDLGEPRKAIEFYDQDLKISREIGNRRGEETTLGNLGNKYLDLGEQDKAIEFYNQALTISREIGDRRGEARHLGNLGVAYFDLGESRKAIGFYDLAIKISREIGHRRDESVFLGKLGFAHFDLDEPRRGIEFCDQALAIAHEIEDKNNECDILCNLSKAHLDIEEIDKAIDYCTESLDLARDIKYRKIEGGALHNLGQAFAVRGEQQKALDHFDCALNIFKDIEYPKGEAAALFSMGEALHKLGKHEDAIKCAQEALEIFQRIESHLAEKVRQELADWESSRQAS